MATLLLVGLLAFSRSVAASMRLGRTNRETTLASEAARRALERLHAETFAEVFARFNDDDADDPAGPRPSPGASFAVAGLDPLPDDPDGRVGRIVFGLDAGVLREDLDLPELGLPRDMNLDGALDGDDRSGDYRLLPVLVRIEWRGSTGPRFQEFKTFLAER